MCDGDRNSVGQAGPEDRWPRSSPLEHWSDDGHEFQVAERLLQAARAGRHDDALVETAGLVVALIARDTEGDPYDGCAFNPGYLLRYPINLRSFRERARSWGSLALKDVIVQLVVWTANTHFRVALQKLGAQPPQGQPFLIFRLLRLFRLGPTFAT